jgi:hypothetical protein
VTAADASAVVARLLDRAAGQRVVERMLAGAPGFAFGLRWNVALPALGTGPHEIDRIIAVAVQRARRAAEAARAAAPVVKRVVSPSPAVPRQQPRARSRRSTAGKRPAAKSGTDDGPAGPHVHVALGAVDVGPQAFTLDGVTLSYCGTTYPVLPDALLALLAALLEE